LQQRRARTVVVSPGVVARGAKAERDVRTSPKALDLENHASAYLTWIANKISNSASKIYRNRFGVGVADWRIIALLAVEPWIPATRISEVIGFDKTIISRSVGFLQERGLVETRFHDNNYRRQFIALTKKGLALHDEIVDIAREREEFLLTELDAKERRALMRLLAKIHSRASLLAKVGET